MLQGTEHPPLLPQPSALSQPGSDAQGGTAQAGTLRASLTDSSKSMASMRASRISKKEGDQHLPYHRMPQHHWKTSPYYGTINTGSPKNPRRDSCGFDSRNELVVAGGRRRRGEREERAALCRETEKRERIKLQRNGYTTRNRSYGRDAIRDGSTGTTREHRRGCELVRPKKRERTRNHRGSCDGETERRCATRGNENRRRLRISPSDGTDEREEEREDSLESFWDCYRVPNLERPGGELEDSYCRYSRRRRKYTDTVWPQDAWSEGEYSDWSTEGAIAWETSEQIERVKKIGGDKQVSRGIRARWRSP
ncbi:uncharacterized protein MONOS_12723 [Monocercomonoides exilis]|uniref:uncharacterized protein n=1 Tax=Monocercomonoides exilis TaxID=2049356 RepID=UPI00355A0AEC|nr:hypothetical protein MONOS_12723 [Monocercomonoides exilis]|eukprot:MONOS_12723.1-p1 / transcript=MONOS_12723.1 / gene=MONOS_12723 / organism=Monocercomonoides_exilis_PA203 / gene_product=unspecified product / transcript_product=unspecified product / location=Mono_scaffold00725:1061-1987(+) / protein_length=309 / sequence_SO=supercontig / SO=protein_coding / is_pseudo=false